MINFQKSHPAQRAFLKVQECDFRHPPSRCSPHWCFRRGVAKPRNHTSHPPPHRVSPHLPNTKGSLPSKKPRDPSRGNLSRRQFSDPGGELSCSNIIIPLFLPATTSLLLALENFPLKQRMRPWLSSNSLHLIHVGPMAQKTHSSCPWC